jgi:hypothetical protein
MDSHINPLKSVGTASGWCGVGHRHVPAKCARGYPRKRPGSTPNPKSGSEIAIGTRRSCFCLQWRLQSPLFQGVRGHLPAPLDHQSTNRGYRVAGPQERPPMRIRPKDEEKCISSNGGHSEGVFLLRGRQPLRFRRLVGLLRSRSYRARNPVYGLCLGHAPGPAPCFGVGVLNQNRSV